MFLAGRSLRQCGPQLLAPGLGRKWPREWTASRRQNFTYFDDASYNEMVIDGALRIVICRSKFYFATSWRELNRAFDLQFIPRIATAVHSRTGHWDSIYFTSPNLRLWGGRIFVSNDQKLLGFTTDSLVTSQLSLWGCHVIWFRIAEISSRLVRREGARKGFSKRILCHNRSNELKISAEMHGNFVGSIVSNKFLDLLARNRSSVMFKNVCSWKKRSWVLSWISPSQWKMVRTTLYRFSWWWIGAERFSVRSLVENFLIFTNSKTFFVRTHDGSERTVGIEWRKCHQEHQIGREKFVSTVC